MPAESLHSSIAIDISDTLRADFDMLRETYFYSSQGEPRQKFSNQSVDKFARYIVCRNYAGICFELSHLCWAIVNTGNHKSLFKFFYVHEAVTARRMRHYFCYLAPDACRVNEASVSLCASDPDVADHNRQHSSLEVRIYQHVFKVHPSRANLLGVCFEWLVTILPNVFERIFDELSGKGFNAIQRMALTLQKEVYDYLAEHLPAAKAQSKFQFLRKWLNQHSMVEFNDDAVLAVWQALRGREGTERYTTVVKDVFQFQEALEKTQHANALHFSEDLDQVYANDTLFECLEMHSQAQIPLKELCDMPKLISKQQVERLQLLSDYPQQCLHFAVSLLRFNVFGPFQAKVIQAQRNKTLCRQTLDVQTDNLYAEQVQKLKAQIALNDLTFYAVLHIVLQQHPEQAIELLAANSHAINEYAAELESSLNDIEGQADINIHRLLTHNGSLQEACKRAYQQTNRQGFTPQTVIADTNIYIERTLALLALSDALRKLLQKNSALFYDNDALLRKYQADGCIFSNELSERMLS